MAKDDFFTIGSEDDLLDQGVEDQVAAATVVEPSGAAAHTEVLEEARDREADGSRGDATTQTSQTAPSSVPRSASRQASRKRRPESREERERRSRLRHRAVAVTGLAVAAVAAGVVIHTLFGGGEDPTIPRIAEESDGPEVQLSQARGPHRNGPRHADGAKERDESRVTDEKTEEPRERDNSGAAETSAPAPPPEEPPAPDPAPEVVAIATAPASVPSTPVAVAPAPAPAPAEGLLPGDAGP